MDASAALQQSEGQVQQQGHQQQAAGTAPNIHTLVLYIFSPTDPGGAHTSCCARWFSGALAIITPIFKGSLGYLAHCLPRMLLLRAEYLNNLQYFIRDGIKADDGCDYVIVVNQVSSCCPKSCRTLFPLVL